MVVDNKLRVRLVLQLRYQEQGSSPLRHRQTRLERRVVFPGAEQAISQDGGDLGIQTAWSTKSSPTWLAIGLRTEVTDRATLTTDPGSALPLRERGSLAI